MTKQISRQNSGNCDKTDFATKQHYLQQTPHFSLLMWRNLSCGEIPPHNRFAWHFSFLMWRNLSCGKFLHMTDFSTFLHITHFAPHLSCGELSLCDRFSSHFSCGETSPHDNLSYGKFSPHDKFFLHNHRLWCVWQISGMKNHQNHQNCWNCQNFKFHASLENRPNHHIH